MGHLAGKAEKGVDKFDRGYSAEMKQKCRSPVSAPKVQKQELVNVNIVKICGGDKDSKRRIKQKDQKKTKGRLKIVGGERFSKIWRRKMKIN